MMNQRLTAQQRAVLRALREQSPLPTSVLRDVRVLRRDAFPCTGRMIRVPTPLASQLGASCVGLRSAASSRARWVATARTGGSQPPAGRQSMTAPKSGAEGGSGMTHPRRVLQTQPSHRIYPLDWPIINWLYAKYLNWRYGPDEWEDGYAEDPLGGSWS